MKSWYKNPWQSEYSERYGLATFVNGKYPTTGRHAAFYIRQDANNVYVVDQWANDPNKPTISECPLRKIGGMLINGSYPDAPNNPEAFYIIEVD